MLAFMIMRSFRITRGGQISIPAEIRHRWSTSRVTLEDMGDHLLVRPAAADPVGALRGVFADERKPGSEQLRRHARAEERAADRRR